MSAVEGAVAVQTIALQPLSPADSRALLLDLLGRDESTEIERIAGVTGHPFFLHELAALSAQGSAARPETPAAAVRARFALLSEVERSVLLLCSLSTGAASPVVLALAAGLEPPAVAEASERLVGTGLLRPSTRGEGSVEPAHDGVREALVSDLDEEGRRALHDDLARAHLAAGTATTHPDVVAHHLAGAGRLREAAPQAERAARRALDAFAFDRAADLFDWVRHLDPELAGPDLLRVRADALTKAGRGPEAAQAYLELAAREADSARRQAARQQASSQLLMSGNLREGYAVMGDALAEAGHPLPRTTAAAIKELVVHRPALRRRGLGWRRRHEVDEEHAARIDTLRGIAFGLGMVDNVRASAYQARALHLALDLGEPTRIASGLAAEAIFRGSVSTSARREARQLIAAARRAADVAGTAEARAWPDVADAVLDAIGGVPGIAPRLKGLEERFRGEAAGTFWARSSTLLVRFLTLRLEGSFRELSDEAPRVIADARRRGDNYLETSVRRGGAILHLVNDAPGAARDDLASSPWPTFRDGFQIQHWLELEALAEIALYEGRGHLALDEYASRFRRLRRSLIPRLQRPRVLIHGLRGRLHLARAYAGLDRTTSVTWARYHAHRLEAEGVTYALPRAYLLRAGAAAIVGDPEVAERWVERAHTLAAERSQGLTRAVAAAYLGRRRGDATLLAEAEAWQRRQQVACFERLANREAPGLFSSRREDDRR